jgi:tetratricopeptide (TPR) repeat protein
MSSAIDPPSGPATGSPGHPDFAFDLALHDTALALAPTHQEDFQRLVKVLTQIQGFRLYFAEMDSIPYRDKLIAQLDSVLQLAGKSTHKMDLSTQAQNPTFADFEASVVTSGPRTVIHLLNSELWLAEHVTELNIRRNAIATRAQCALVWWLPRSAITRVANDAPDVWSWRHGVFSFAMTAPDAIASRDDLLRNATRVGNEGMFSGSLPQKSKRLANIRQLLIQEIPDEMRWPLVMEMAALLSVTGHPVQAEELLRAQALPLAAQIVVAHPTAHAVTMGRIADTLQARGELDEALRIRREEQLQVYEKLDDVYLRAVTMGKIADILQMQGELDKALQIYREEELPVYEKMGDVRSRAIAMGKIADILQAKGELDEALRIRREEELPVYEKIGDVRERAVTMGNIAVILRLRGELDEALRIYGEEVVPVFEKLGDLRSLLTGKIILAQTLALRGKQEDRQEIDTLLRQAHALATRLNVPYRHTIEQIYRHIFEQPL